MFYSSLFFVAFCAAAGGVLAGAHTLGMFVLITGSVIGVALVGSLTLPAARADDKQLMAKAVVFPAVALMFLFGVLLFTLFT